MKSRIMLIGLSVLMAALVVGCGSFPALPTLATERSALAAGGAGMVPATDPTTNGLWVVGTGEASADPEVARITFGVDLRGEAPGALVDEGSRKNDAAISALRQMGVAEDDIKTIGYSLWVETVHDPDTGMPTGEVIYHVSHQTQATVYELDSVGDILAALVEAGVNTISEVSFSVDEPQALIEQARQAALQDAQERAQRMAEGLAIALGKPVLVTEGGASIPVSARGGVGGGGAIAEMAAPSISPGAFSVSVSVQVVYEIK